MLIYIKNKIKRNKTKDMMQLLSDTLDNRQHRTVMPEGRETRNQPFDRLSAHCLQFQITALPRGRTQTKPGD